MGGFDHITTWVFDLDHTLYPPEVPLFAQMDKRMDAWIAARLGLDVATAHDVRLDYYHRYGTSLAGLMAEHGIGPEPFLSHVHDIDFSVIPSDPDLGAQIANLPGRKMIYTNGTKAYAKCVLGALGFGEVFDAIYGLEEADYHPKPRAEAFEAVFAMDGLSPDRAAMFEDQPRNLVVPKALGMTTVHVAPLARDADHIDHHTDDLAGFLGRLGA